MADDSGGFGNYLRKLRESKKLSTRQVRVFGGPSSSYLSQVENGKRDPSARKLKELAPIYGVPVEELLARAGYLTRAKTPRPPEKIEVHKETLGEYLSKKIGDNGDHIEDVAKEAKINRMYLFQIISGQEEQPPPLILKRLAEVLDVDYFVLAGMAGYLKSNGAKKRIWMRGEGLTHDDVAEILAIIELKEKRRARSKERRQKKPPGGG